MIFYNTNYGWLCSLKGIEMTHSKKHSRWIDQCFTRRGVCHGVVLLVFLSLTSACEEKPKAFPPPKGENRVEVLQVEPETFQETIVSSAVAAPYREYRVSMQIGGMLAAQHVDRGDSINEGDVLFKIDSEAFQLRVKEREANLARAAARLNFMGEEQKRKKPLYKEGTISETAWDKHQFDLALARAERDQARVALDQAERDLRLTTLRSAISGRVLERYHDPGEVLPEGTVLAWIVNSIEILFEVGVSDIELRNLHLKDVVEITVDAFPTKSFKGHVVRIAGNANPQTGTFAVEVRVPNPQLEILPGMIGRLKLLGEMHHDQIVIPLMSVHQQGEDQVVYIVEENHIFRKPVRLGKVLGDRVIIQEGIEVGSTVILMSQRRLAEGNTVKITNEQ